MLIKLKCKYNAPTVLLSKLVMFVRWIVTMITRSTQATVTSLVQQNQMD